MTVLRPPASTLYELTVAGALGPVLRSALRPQLAARSQLYTVVRMAPLPGSDLVDLVLQLHSRGFDIAEIREASTAPAG